MMLAYVHVLLSASGTIRASEGDGHRIPPLPRGGSRPPIPPPQQSLSRTSRLISKQPPKQPLLTTHRPPHQLSPKSHTLLHTRPSTLTLPHPHLLLPPLLPPPHAPRPDHKVHPAMNHDIEGVLFRKRAVRSEEGVGDEGYRRRSAEMEQEVEFREHLAEVEDYGRQMGEFPVKDEDGVE